MKKKLTKNNFFKTSAILKKAKTTTALTCLIGTMMLTQNPAMPQTTTTGSMVVSTSVASTCTVNANAMNFAAYTGAAITETSVVTANCTNATTFTISFNDTPDSSPAYYLVRLGGSSSTASDRINVTFTNTAGATMTNAAATITGTGTGSTATVGTITGSIAASQTGKTAGTYSKTMTLNLVY